VADDFVSEEAWNFDSATHWEESNRHKERLLEDIKDKPDEKANEAFGALAELLAVLGA
jgi:hypothetical protein